MYTSITQKGQVVVPKKFREELDLKSSDKLHVALEGGRLILTPLSKLDDLFGAFSPKTKLTKAKMKRLIKE